jgi:Glycosyl transferases group 1
MTVRILCNLPLECFEARTAYSGVELVTYGPRERMWVDGVHFPFDVEFDPSTGDWAELERRLPAGFRPDFVLVFWPDQEPLPANLHRCPVPVVGIVSDYNLSLAYLAGLWPFFDVLLCDRSGVGLFRKLPFADVRWFCQYTFKRPFHRVWPDTGPRDVDIAFAGNMHPRIQQDRRPWMQRLRRLESRGVKVVVQSGLAGIPYGQLLARTRIGFNRSLRGEMNLRAFEVPACGALLFMERENLEVRDFLTPGEEVVLYGDDDFEELVLEHLRDEPRRARMAAAGHRRIQQHSMRHRLDELCRLLSVRGPGRPPATDAQAALGRAMAMQVSPWASREAILAASLAAARLAPRDPRALNTLAIANLTLRGADGAFDAMQLLDGAAVLSPTYVPAAWNRYRLLAESDHLEMTGRARAEFERRLAAPACWSDLDGLFLPVGFRDEGVERAAAFQQAVRCDDPGLLAQNLAGFAPAGA